MFGHRMRLFGLVFVLIMSMSVAHGAVEYINATWHLANDNNDYMFVDQRIKMTNGSFAGSEAGYISAYASKDTGSLGDAFFTFEIWANLSSPSYRDDNKLTIFYENEDTQANHTAEYRIYDTHTFIDNLYCMTVAPLSNVKCIFMADGENLGAGAYSFYVEYSSSEIAKQMGLNRGFFDPSELDTLMFGLTTSNAKIENTTSVMSHSKKLNVLLSVDQISITLLEGSSFVTDSTLPFDVEYRGFYSPYDIGIAIVDNTTWAEKVENIGYYIEKASTSVVGYKETTIRTSNEYKDMSYLMSGLSIYDMEIVGEIAEEDYNQDLSTDKEYKFMVFQRRNVGVDNYKMLIASTDFTFIGDLESDYNYLNTYSFDTLGHNVYNTTLTDLWLSIYSFDVDQAVADGKIQGNYLDIFPYYKQKSTEAKVYTNYSVYTDASGEPRISIQLDNWDSVKDNLVYLAYGKDSVVSSNDYYVSNQIPKLDIEDAPYQTAFWDTNYVDVPLMNFFTTDKIWLYSSDCERVGGATVKAMERFKIKNEATGKDFNIDCGSYPSDVATSSVEFFDIDNNKVIDCSSASNSKINMYTENKDSNATVANDLCVLNETYDTLNLEDLGSASVLATTATQTDSNEMFWLQNKEIRFKTNVWELTLLSSQNIGEGVSLTELAFELIDNDYHYQQIVQARNDNLVRTLKVYVDNDPLALYKFDPTDYKQLDIDYYLAQGDHTLKVVFGDKEVKHEVYVSSSNLSKSYVTITSVEDLTEDTIASINRADSGIRGLLDGLFDSYIDAVLVVIGLFTAIGIGIAFKTGQVLGIPAGFGLGVVASLVLYGSEIIESIMPFGAIAFAVVALLGIIVAVVFYFKSQS